MNLLKDRRVIFIGGATAALAAGLGIAVTVAMQQDQDDVAPPASVGGLVIQTGRQDDHGLDPARPLRCFVNGHPIGEMTVLDCAKRNGVATGALEVGMDSSGALVAAKAAPPDSAPPLPPGWVMPSGAEQATTDDDSDGDRGQGKPCSHYVSGAWGQVADDVSLSACVQALFQGECVRPGGADYGHWGARTLRLVLGKVEISADNRTFRTLVQQQAGCAVPDLN